MTLSAEQKIDVLDTMPRLLASESADELASLRGELKQEIKPRDFIERIYVDDMAAIIWDILRLRRWKTGIINNSILAALQAILKQMLFRRDFDNAFEHEEASEKLAYSWFESEKAKTQVAKLLRAFQMDEGAIEAEAFRLCCEDLDRMDRMMTSAELRRDRALRCVAEYRHTLAKQLQQSTERILEHDEIPLLVSVGKKPD